MRKTLWIILGALFLAMSGPVAFADSFTYSFVGSGYFAGTAVSFTASGPAVMGTEYSANPGSTDEFVTNGGPTVDEGAIEFIEWRPSPFAFCGGSSPCTVQMLLFTAADPSDGPTIFGTSVPSPGSYGEFFGHGTLTITETPTGTPEPSSFASLLSGVALFVLILAMRKRAAAIRTQAS